MKFTVLIPARRASTRLPDKVLQPLDGLPMVEQVRRRAVESGATRVVVAADDPHICAEIRSQGGEAVLTDPGHHCGSERLAEAAKLLDLPGDEIIVNLQGDEPAMPPALIRAVAETLATSSAPVATVAVPLLTWAELMDPHAVKVVLDQQGRALYFSRAPIPWLRDRFPLPLDASLPQGQHLRHLGLYAYRHAFLQDYARWSPGRLEQAESLEQLRILERGYALQVYTARTAPLAGVDTPEDLSRMQAFFSTHPVFEEHDHGSEAYPRR